MSLDRDLERFAAAHAAELTAADQFTLGRAAGIITRVHAPYVDDAAATLAAGAGPGTTGPPGGREDSAMTDSPPGPASPLPGRLRQ